MTDIVFRYTIAVCQSLLWSPEEEKPELVLCFTIYPKVACVSRWRLNDDTLLPKIINIGLDSLELFEHITGVWNFLRHSVVCQPCWISCYSLSLTLAHRPQLCLVLSLPSSSSCTCILLSAFPTPGLSSKYSLIVLFLYVLAVYTVMPLWLCYHHFFTTCD